MRQTNKGRGFPKTHIPIKQHPVKKATYQEQNAGIKKMIDVDAVMKAGENPLNSITAIPWNRNPYPTDQIASKKTVIFRPSKAQIDLGVSTKKNPINMEAGISGIGPVYPEKKSSKFMPKNSKKISVQAAPILNVEPKAQMPNIEKQWEQIPMHAGQNHELQFDGETEYMYPETTHRKKQEISEQWAEGNDFTSPIHPSIPNIDKRDVNYPVSAGYVYDNQDTDYNYVPKERSFKSDYPVRANPIFNGEVYDYQNYQQERVTNGNVSYNSNQNFETNVNPEFYVEEQHKPYRARVQEQHAQYNLEDEIKIKAPSNKKINKTQVRLSSIQSHSIISVDPRSSNPSAKQNRKHQVESKKATGLDEGNSRIEDRGKVKSEKKQHQVKVTSIKAEASYNANNNHNPSHKVKTKTQADINLKSVPELPSDMRSSIPNTKFVRKQETESSRPMMTIKMPMGDSKIRIQNALNKVSKPESAKPSNLEANVQLNQINAVRPVHESHQRKMSTKIENLNAESILPENRLVEPIKETNKIESAKPSNLNSNKNFNVKIQAPILGNNILKATSKPETENAGMQVYDGRAILDETPKISGKFDHKVVGTEIDQFSKQQSIIPPPMNMDETLFTQGEAKSNIARPEQVVTNSSISVSSGEKPQIKTHSKRREVLIQQDISAGSNKTMQIKTPSLANFKSLGDL